MLPEFTIAVHWLTFAFQKMASITAKAYARSVDIP